MISPFLKTKKESSKELDRNISKNGLKISFVNDMTTAPNAAAMV